MRLGLDERLAWRRVLEEMADAVAAALTGEAGTEHGRERLGVGAGGDRTAIVDRVAEDAIVAACERIADRGTHFTLRSEELGERDFGAPLPLLVADPVDGSLNAMFGIPYYSTSLALLDGERLGDVAVGVVRNLAGRGCFVAVRDGGVERDGRPLEPLAVGLDRGRIPMLLMEGHRVIGDFRAAEVLSPLARNAIRVRMLGSAALSLCQVATGAASALVAPDGMRPWDCAAGLLVIHEVGGIVTDLGGVPLIDRDAGFGERAPIVASLSAEVHARVRELLRAGL